jgi:hypothetical protein
MENINIDQQIFEVRKNVKSQTCDISKSELFFEYYDSNNETDSSNSLSVFLLFETCMDSAFGHWIYESAIYLSYFFELKSKYPELKLLVKQNPKRNYKSLFFKALNIHENDIHWLNNEEINDCKTVYINIPSNNICINTKPHYLNTVQVKNTTTFKNLIFNFRNKIITNLNITYPQEKTIDYLFFPRSKIENYASNDRIMNYEKIYKLLEGKKYTEYDTINTVDLKHQIELLVSSKNIFLDWGSSFFVNSLFCNNSNIYITHSMKHQLKYEGNNIIYNIHTQNNNIQM